MEEENTMKPIGEGNPTPLLEVRNLTRSFGGILAVNALSFDVFREGITGLIGPNGAGKTTVFNLITGVYAPSVGTIKLEGNDIAGLRPNIIVSAGIARTFQNIRLFKNLSCLENVKVPLAQKKGYGLCSALLGLPKAKRAERNTSIKALELLDALGIANMAERPAATLPYGVQRKLEIARALAGAPKLLLLDEPAAGMNEAETEVLAESIVKVQKNFGVAILLIEHHINLVMNICEHVVVMERGGLLAEGLPESIRVNERVIHSYLGRRGQT